MSYETPKSVEEFMTFQPYAMWARARSECPVIRTEGHAFDPRPSFQVTRYADAVDVLRDWETFSSGINAEVIGQYMGELILAMDGPEHRQYRNLVAHTFRASVLERWDAELVRPVIGSLLDRIAPLGRADLVRDVTAKYPVQVICGIVGVPIEDHEQFAKWAEEINTGPLDPPRAWPRPAAMRAYLEPLVDARRRTDPQGDPAERARARRGRRRAAHRRKLYGFLRLLLPAGGETTFRVMGNALAALLTHPDALGRGLRRPRRSSPR